MDKSAEHFDREKYFDSEGSYRLFINKEDRKLADVARQKRVEYYGQVERERRDNLNKRTKPTHQPMDTDTFGIAVGVISLIILVTPIVFLLILWIYHQF